MKLTGVVDFGGAPEAVIEAPPNSASKTYRTGDIIGATGARIKAIAEGIVVDYDGKTYRVTFKGVQEEPLAGPIGGAGGSQ